MGLAAQELARWVGMNLVIDGNLVVHATAVATDSADRPVAVPACGIGWNGMSGTRFVPTDRPVTCARPGCHASGTTVHSPPAPRPGEQAELFTAADLARFA